MHYLGTESEATVLSNSFIQDLGVTENVFEGFVKLELLSFAVQLECPTWVADLLNSELR